MFSSQVIDRETANKLDTCRMHVPCYYVKTLQNLHSCVIRNFTRSMSCSTQDIVNVYYRIYSIRDASYGYAINSIKDDHERYSINAIHIFMDNGFDYLFTRYANSNADAPLTAIAYDEFTLHDTHYRVEHEDVRIIADRIRYFSPKNPPDSARWEIHLSLPAEKVTEILHHKRDTHRIDKRIKHRDNKIYHEWDEPVEHYPIRVISSTVSPLEPETCLNTWSKNNPPKKENKLSDFSLTKMHKDRDVSLNHLVRDFKRASYAEDDDSHIKDVFLHVPCVDINRFGKYILRIDELAIKYTNNDEIYRYQIRYDCYCENPEVDNTIIIGEDARENDPFIRIACGQSTIVNHIEGYSSIESVEPFWMRVNLKLTPFKPNGKDKTVMYHKLTIASEMPVMATPSIASEKFVEDITH